MSIKVWPDDNVNILNTLPPWALCRKEQGLIQNDTSELVSSSAQLHQDIQNSTADLSAKLDQTIEGGSELINHVHAGHRGLYEKVEGANRQFTILQALRFEKSEERFDNVQREFPETFRWVFEKDYGGNNIRSGSLSFIEWLECGNGLFHIEGKAGSGKSTLMKYIYLSAQTAESLTRWARPNQLVLGQFFFWRAGTPSRLPPDLSSALTISLTWLNLDANAWLPTQCNDLSRALAALCSMQS